MHPILGRPRRLGLYLLGWLPIAVILTIGLGQGVPWPWAAAYFASLSLAYAFIGLSAWYVCRTFPVESGFRLWRLGAVQAAAGAAAGAAWVTIGGWVAQVFSNISPPAGEQLVALHTTERALLFAIGVLLFWLAAAVHYVVIAVAVMREAETRALEQNLLAREAELKALRMQIDPHFLFNSLHSINALISTDAAAARRMCLLLGDFLRDTLRLGASERITLADEVALAERFLAIEHVRLGARLRVTRDAAADACDCLVPPLLLQPLVENAVVHGVDHLIEGGTVAFAARRHGAVLVITLENPCDPDRTPRRTGSGLGLDLLRRRLTAQFGAESALQVDARPERFRVELRMPAVFS